jgi:hypothetical protein
MKRWLFMLGFLSIGVVLANCGDDPKAESNPTPDGGGLPSPTTTLTSNPPPPDAGLDGAIKIKRTACLDKPGAPRPSERLPCELIPPGLVLQ